jgi:hypothetical protein
VLTFLKLYQSAQVIDRLDKIFRRIVDGANQHQDDIPLDELAECIRREMPDIATDLAQKLIRDVTGEQINRGKGLILIELAKMISPGCDLKPALRSLLNFFKESLNIGDSRISYLSEYIDNIMVGETSIPWVVSEEKRAQHIEKMQNLLKDGDLKKRLMNSPLLIAIS